MDWIVEESNFNTEANKNKYNHKNLTYYDKVKEKKLYICLNKLPKYLIYYKNKGYENIVNVELPILNSFNDNNLIKFLTKLGLKVINLTKEAPRLIETMDTRYAYDTEHVPILISSFAQNGCRFTTQSNYLESIFTNNSIKISFALNDLSASEFLSISTSFFMGLENDLINYHAKIFKNGLAGCFNKLPFDH